MHAVEMIGICKRYPGVVANDNVGFTLEAGEIHGLVGENGAGKSTLMNILYGMQLPDSGIIRINGQEEKIDSPKTAIRHGIGMVHQHFMLAPSLSVLDNIILGAGPGKGPFIDFEKAGAQVEALLAGLGFQLDLNEKVYHLSIGQMQRVEIVKALYRGAKILILDEPTAVLTPQEADELIHTMRVLQQKGTSVVIITHKLKEVMKATDRITVLRKGVVTGSLATASTNESMLAELMVGHEINMGIERHGKLSDEKVLEIHGLEVADNRGQPAVKGVSFDVRKGEIVGICGVEGNGQTELVYAVTGLTRIQSGKIRLDGREIQQQSVRQRRKLGMAHIPEDRLSVGAAKDCSIKENLMLTTYYQKDFCRCGVLNGKKLQTHADDMIKKYGIKVPSSRYALGTLSGGNMQKVIISREISTKPRLLVAAQPTRGVDVGAIMNIRNDLNRLRDEGMAILLVSAELEEIMALSDRILVMYEGEIVGEFRPGETTERELGLYMAGARRMIPEGDRA